MNDYEATWPEVFHCTITKKVITMAMTMKHVKVGSPCIFGTELIYSRLMCMMNSRDLDLEDMFSHELAPISTSIFDEMREMRITTTKATLKNKIKVEMST